MYRSRCSNNSNFKFQKQSANVCHAQQMTDDITNDNKPCNTHNVIVRELL